MLTCVHRFVLPTVIRPYKLNIHTVLYCPPFCSVVLFMPPPHKTTSGLLVIPLLNHLWEEKNRHIHLYLFKLGCDVHALLSSVMYILSGENITAVYTMSQRRWDQNTTQVDNRLNRARATYVRLLHLPPWLSRQSENHGYTDYTECQAFCPVVRIGSPSLSPQASVAPPFGSWGETHSLVRERVGWPNSDEG
jgi:hypothetical protein